MQLMSYFRSVSEELQVVRNRVRHMIDTPHWPTDGEWKESVLRSLIRRTAPSSSSIGRGFVVDSTRNTSQIDVLIHDSSHPVLYRDGDLAFVTPASCMAIIEVKTSMTISTFRKACMKLADNAEFVRLRQRDHALFVGMFVYEQGGVRLEQMANVLARVAEGNHRRVIDHVVVGGTQFLKYWEVDPRTRDEGYRSWHGYSLGGIGPGYFLHNLLLHLGPQLDRGSAALWFPERSKEADLEVVEPFRG